ncbi:MAG: DUF2336 domain-containing protein [Rhodospirillaceae bacterium]
MTEHLTQNDVAKLLTDPSPDHRAQLAGKVAVHFDRNKLTPDERKIAEDIIRFMARDTVERVRQSLAENLKSSPDLPRDIALIMARDVESVAVPVLSVSRVLSESDLIEIVRGGSPAKQSAIAIRPEVSETLADELIEVADESAIAALVGNEGAKLGENHLNKVIDRFGDSASVQYPLVRRSRLPLTVAERLVTLVSENLQQYLVTHHELPDDVASSLVLKSRERATVNLFTGESDEAAVVRLVTQLVEGGRLTPSLLIRSLCTGDMTFFEVALSHLAGVPLTNARLLIHDGGRLGLKSLYDKAGLPANRLPVVRIAVDVAHETPFDGEAHDRERHSRRMIERILTQYEELETTDIDYLLNKLGDIARSDA